MEAYYFLGVSLMSSYNQETIDQIQGALDRVIASLRDHLTTSDEDANVGFIVHGSGKTSALEQAVGISPEDVQIALLPTVVAYLAELPTALNYHRTPEEAFRDLMSSLVTMAFLGGIDYQIHKGEVT